MCGGREVVGSMSNITNGALCKRGGERVVLLERLVEERPWPRSPCGMNK
jgi:hypothetical protein